MLTGTLPHPAPRTGWPLPLRSMLNPKSPENSRSGMRSETAVRRCLTEASAVEGDTGERSRWSTPVQWAWLDLDQRPHPQVKCLDRPASCLGKRSGRCRLQGDLVAHALELSDQPVPVGRDA